ncbi:MULTISPECIES: S-layer homology domain-containing protein [unclassified Paenibacillus]|uniref:S-layer homology domain-containing protein n=1 Tax=unclassified Paenibacillus TaxID=185978 RepID=UPI00363CFE9A
MKVYKIMPKLMMAVILLSALSHIDEPRVAALDKSSFTDLPESHWSFKAVQEMYGKKIVDGYPDGTFRPNQTLTRAEFAALLYKTAQLNEKKVDSAAVFKDVDSSAWYKPYADALKGMFVQNSLKSETDVFNPDAPALREDVAAAIVRLRGWAGGKPADLQSKFNDFNSISEGAVQDLATAVERGIISGYEDGTIRGKAALTRAEATVVLTKAFSEEMSSSTEQEPAKKSEAAAQIPEAPIKTQPLNPKPIYAIVDLLAEDVGITYTGSYTSGRSVLDKLPISNLTVDSEGKIYFVETTNRFSVSHFAIKRQNDDAQLASTVETVNDSMIASLSGPIFDKIRGQKNITKYDLTPIKILDSVNSSDKQFIVNWINGNFWSLFSFSDKKIPLVNTVKGTTMTTQDFIIQHPNGDYLFSDITNRNIQRIKPGDGENEQIAAFAFSGKPLTALVQGELLYILDPGLKSIIKVDLQSRKLVEKIGVQTDNIVSATTKDNQFYISTGKSLFSVELTGRIEPFLEERQLVYNDLSLNNIYYRNHNEQREILEISEFAFEPTGNIVFLDKQSSNFMRRLKLVKNQTIEPKPLPVLQTGSKLAKPKVDFINQDIGIQKDEQGNMILSMVSNDQGNLYAIEKKLPVNHLLLWYQESSTWASDLNSFFGMRFDYYDDHQKQLKPRMITYTGGLHFDGRGKGIYRTAWSQDLNIASINLISPEAITVGYMADKGPITEKDFIAFNGTGQMVVSDVTQGELWFIDRDRKGYKLLPSEVGLEIRYSGKSTAALWYDQKLSVLDTGNKTLTQVKINDHQYAAQTADLKIEGTIDAVSTHEDKFYVMSGTVLYCIETNGSISWTEDLAGYLRERKPIHKMSMDSNGRLMLLDERGNLQRVQLYEAKK